MFVMSATAGNEEITSLEMIANLDIPSYQQLQCGLKQGFPSGALPFPNSSFLMGMCFKHCYIYFKNTENKLGSSF
jgi:hypothetical protein